MLHFVERRGIIRMSISLSKLITINKGENMEIFKVIIKGFRNISRTEISFDKMTALVGLNGYGKSNIMDAIDIALDFIKYPPQVKSKIMTSKQEIPLLKDNPGQNFEFQIDLV